MSRAARAVAVIAMSILVTGCDKCGNFDINLPGLSAPKACTGSKPRG
jgi:hypothetical protein